MNKKQLYSILASTFYVIALFNLADKGFTTFAIICLGLGSIMMCASVKEKNDGSK